ncbi:CidA/LrgA family protein [Thalassotalea piscium]
MDLSTKDKLFNIVYAILALLICLACGYAIEWLVGGLPPSLYGMAVLTIALQSKWIDADRLNASVAWGIRHMGVCFVPAGVGIIEHQDLIKTHGIAIVGITFITTFLLLSLVGLIYQGYEKRSRSHADTEPSDKI